MTPGEIGLGILSIILLVIIIWMVMAWKRAKPQPKTFGFREAEGFLGKVPAVTPEEIRRLILPWSTEVLGYSNTVGEDADRQINTLREASRVKGEEIKGTEATIAQLQRRIAGGRDEIAANDKRVGRVAEVKKIFGS